MPAGRSNTSRLSLSRSIFWLFALALGCALSGCTLLSAGGRLLKTPDQLMKEYGYSVLSEPMVFPLKDVETVIGTSVQEVTFKEALEEARIFQSAAFRRRQVRQRLAIQGSANALALQALQQGDPTAASTAPPGLPGADALTADATFAGGALAEVPGGVRAPFSGRIQTALHNVLLSRLTSSQIALLKKDTKDWDAYVVFSMMTVIPGEKTKLDSSAAVRMLWTLCAENTKPCNFDAGGTLAEDLRVVPVFPTYNSVSELNDAASMREFALSLAALAQYGPAQAQGSYQRLVNDVQRLVSASERVTLIGSSLHDDVVGMQIGGVRVARPLEELRPRGKTRIEPLTLPTVTVVMIRKTAFNDKAVALSMQYASRWLRDRPWWDKLPPGTFLPGFWYDAGTGFTKPKARTSGRSFLHGYNWKSWVFPWGWPDLLSPAEFTRGVAPAGRFETIQTVKKGQPTIPKPLRIYSPTGQVIPVNHPYGQVIVVCGAGDAALGFFADNIPVPARRIGDSASFTITAPAVPSANFAPKDLSRALTAKQLDKRVEKKRLTAQQALQVKSERVECLGELTPEQRGDLTAAQAAELKNEQSAYLLFLEPEVLRELAKSRGITPLDVRSDVASKKGHDPRQIPITGANIAGPATSTAYMDLAFDVFYAPPPERERLSIDRDGAAGKGDEVFDRDSGTAWPGESYKP
jgi:hypothetical protein